ncbi:MULTISPECIES: CHAP domain-containing protein [unclassified Novosphingobium]|uniref:CHAP domain-containing protein n=1 Tax=unclassified Novosphingobium TaxID=2644732 RepID=UPI001F3F8319|nr:MULTISPECIES: CHAP domain-containing protein [unclassified Novosphingobium]
MVPVIAAIATSLAATFAIPAMAQPLQCAPYARANSAIDLHGNAATWWAQAEGNYDRGQTPRTGSVLVFKASGAMRVGHVAVVKKIVDDRHVVLNHANWSRPGMIEPSAMAEDVSAKGDWSNVRVWYSPTQSLGLRASAAFGFIYAPGTQDAAPATAAPRRERFETAFADIAAKG